MTVDKLYHFSVIISVKKDAYIALKLLLAITNKLRKRAEELDFQGEFKLCYFETAYQTEVESQGYNLLGAPLKLSQFLVTKLALQLNKIKKIIT